MRLIVASRRAAASFSSNWSSDLEVFAMTDVPPDSGDIPVTTVISTFLLNSPDPKLYSLTDHVVRSDRNIPLDDALKLAEHDPIWINRGKAIQAYAILEQSLSRLLGDLAGTDQETTATIFYRIVNTGSRSAILERLLHKKHGTTFNLFWNQYFKDLRQIDLRRNAIVHWLTAMNAALNTQDTMIVGLNLIPPSSLGRSSPKEYVTSSDLIDFACKCSVYGRLSNMFCSVTSTTERGLDEDAKKTWFDIFQRPLVYPLPEDHPLNQSAAKPDIPPQSSPA